MSFVYSVFVIRTIYFNERKSLHYIQVSLCFMQQNSKHARTQLNTEHIGFVRFCSLLFKKYENVSVFPLTCGHYWLFWKLRILSYCTYVAILELNVFSVC